MTASRLVGLSSSALRIAANALDSRDAFRANLRPKGAETYRPLLRLLRRTVGAAVLAPAILMFCANAWAQDAPALDTTQPAPVPKMAGIVLLFDGTPESLTANWRQNGKAPQWSVENGAMTSVKSDITTRDSYTDFQLHVEFRVPYMPDKKGQARGNSGVKLQNRYEIQILDSYGIREPGSGDCGAVYHQYAPLVNACKPPLQWQTYDIAYRAPRFDAQAHVMTEPARVTVLQNGLFVQNSQVINGPTTIVKPKRNADGTLAPPPPVEDPSTPGPIRLQFHGNTVAFRNIWILPLPAQAITRYEPR